MLTTNECFIQNNTEVTFSSNVMGDTPWSKEELFSTQFWIRYSSRHYNNDHYQQLQVKTVQYAIYLSLKLSHKAPLHVRYKHVTTCSSALLFPTNWAVNWFRN